jgi:uncharacterized protein (TIGR03067 family)
MRAAMLTLFSAVVLPAAAGEPKETPEAKDEKLLAGTWELDKFWVEGDPIPKRLFKGTTLVFKDGKYTLNRADEKKPTVWKLRLDAAKKPRQINLDPVNKTTPARMGIYEVKGDTLKIAMCGVKRKAGRPKSFKPDLSVDVVTFKRLKETTR